MNGFSISWDQNIRLKHMCTRRYLAVINGKLALVQHQV